MNKLTTTILSASLAVCAGVASAADRADIRIQRVQDLSGVQAIPQSTVSKTDIYIVQLKGDPVLGYEGGVQGYKATKPGKGNKINPNSAHVRKYAAHLEAQQNQVIESVGASKVYNYRYSFNGFAARMSAADAEALKSRGDVLNVWRDELLQPQTNTSPAYLDLTGGGEMWSKASGLTGEDIVIGIIDTGIWPEHPSFADVPTPKMGNQGPEIPYGPIPSSFTPSGCDFGNDGANPLDAPYSCQNKLVTARCYNSAFSTGPDAGNPCGGDGAFALPTEFQSARDNDGHGSHVASTAGGNYGVPAQIQGEFLGEVSGMAPRARIAAYKVCWNGSTPPAGFPFGCGTADSAAAIDTAVADGVDVINFSIGGSGTNFNGAEDIAFLFAADAGVFVATSQGNTGPAPQTTGTPSGVPWITAVGANQDDQVFGLVVTVNSPASIAGNKEALEGNGPVQLSDTGAISGDVVLVDDGTGDPADGCSAVNNDVSGKIALAIRGTCSFSTKYNTAAAAGATAVIVYNDGTAPGRFDPIVMSAPGTTIPGVMVGFEDGSAMAAETGVTATLDPNNLVSRNNRVAGFSSRGPNGGAPDIIKPDLGAPGVDILAAQTPIPNDGQTPDQLFQIISGTSMSSPHVAGVFALLKQAHPDWTPAMARSALMTTARQNLKKTFGEEAADPFDIGAGAIVPNAAVDPGLAYDVGLLEYAAFTCGNNVQIFTQGTCDFLAGLGLSFDGSELNLPSIGIADLAGTQTVTRTVTSVASNQGLMSYTVSVDAPPGIDVSVTPTTLKLKPGQSASYQVTFTANSNAVLDEWAFGSLTWSHAAKYSVRSPIAIKPVKLATAEEVDGQGTDGSVGVPVQFGYTGDYFASVSGLEESAAIPSTIGPPQGNLQAFCGDFPAMAHLRFATYDADTSPAGADIDLRLFYAPGGCAVFDISQIGASGTATSEEVIDVSNAPAGGYVFVIDYFDSNNPTGVPIDYTAWIQPVFGDNGNTVVTAPASAVTGASDVVSVDYSGLNPGTRYLGILHHEDAGGEIARTIIDVDTQ